MNNLRVGETTKTKAQIVAEKARDKQADKKGNTNVSGVVEDNDDAPSRYSYNTGGRPTGATGMTMTLPWAFLKRHYKGTAQEDR